LIVEEEVKKIEIEKDSKPFEGAAHGGRKAYTPRPAANKCKPHNYKNRYLCDDSKHPRYFTYPDCNINGHKSLRSRSCSMFARGNAKVSTEGGLQP
jgi:hypothetical protein